MSETSKHVQAEMAAKRAKYRKLAAEKALKAEAYKIARRLKDE